MYLYFIQWSRFHHKYKYIINILDHEINLVVIIYLFIYFCIYVFLGDNGSKLSPWRLLHGLDIGK